MLNHILGAEPIAMQRLKAHAGRSIDVRFRALQRLLPGRLAFQVTRAGLLEQRDDVSVEADLGLTIDIETLLQESPSAQRFIETNGDTALAHDVAWLFDSVRWDLGGDLERFAGPVAAAAIERVAAAAATSVRRTLRAFVPRAR